MRIVIDLQGAQAENGKRGIGRYSLSLAKAIAKNSDGHEIFLALNGAFPESIDQIRVEFSGILPQDNIRVWYPFGAVSELGLSNDWYRKAAELSREAFISSLAPSVVLVSSMFEGLVDNAVTSIGALYKGIPTAVVLYDLIPLIHRDIYLTDIRVNRWYERKVGQLKLADHILAISESSRAEAMDWLGIPENSVTNISAAIDPEFYAVPETENGASEVLRKFGLERQFLMYTGGADKRKNLESLIEAFSVLPEHLKVSHHLAIVCSISPGERDRLASLAIAYGLAEKDVIFTGFVSDGELRTLYKACKAFVFASWHEGFGLPVLEAMACGSAVIAANTSSLPEVVGNESALFNPFDVSSISGKLQQVLEDEELRRSLAQHGKEHVKNFSWEKSAKSAIRVLEGLQISLTQDTATARVEEHRPRLAFVSPLPPVRSGISAYAAELLPELAKYYEIELVIDQNEISDTYLLANFPVRSTDWFLDHANRFDRVVYHFGNSPFHRHMFTLLEEVPGVVVLHDFFLSGVVSHLELASIVPGFWRAELYRSHGYSAVNALNEPGSADAIEWKYPCNRSVLTAAEGVIVHSDEPKRLAVKWYGNNVSEDWACIPLLRVPARTGVLSKDEVRGTLGLNPSDFVICSFGMLGPSKLNHCLLEAWLASPLAKDQRCKLVFVGECPNSEYGREFLQALTASGMSDRIQITGWVKDDIYHQYLQVADVAVQLRSFSRGETSAAALDCMNYEVATIVNSNGSMAELPDNCVVKLPDEFTQTELVSALMLLWQDASKRKELGAAARKVVSTEHNPSICAARYHSAIERFSLKGRRGLNGLIEKVVKLSPDHVDLVDWFEFSTLLDRSLKNPSGQRQIFVDISELVQRDSRTGIQRVVRSILREWLVNPMHGCRVEPIYANPVGEGYRYAREFTNRFLGEESKGLGDDPISYQAGDIFLGLDLQHHVVISHKDFYQHLRRHGVEVRFVVYDLLPILHPEFFVSAGEELHNEWLSVVVNSDGAICISNAVADELLEWLKNNSPSKIGKFKVDWFHLGGDVVSSTPTKGLPENSENLLDAIRSNVSFTMVGTIEPRKGHSEVLEAFENLWAEAVEVNLVLVGKKGWKVDELEDCLNAHPELGRRLFWIQDCSDEFLEELYAASCCLIAASYGEGFGLPIIEAAKHSLPIIARDIPVFREVAGNSALYFGGKSAAVLASAIKEWLVLFNIGTHPVSHDIPWLTWRESSRQLGDIVVGLSNEAKKHELDLAQ